ncbi:MAG: hypothetical protein RMN52_04535 [Anaerolineae bacterium]|nr:peroxiredoxin family protein [Candidatus Roseilinea sp.]MDW8449249.1 hypothetical protein [Anaerolineae bacterium]
MSSERVSLRIPQVSEPAPDFEATDVDGCIVALSQHPKPVAPVFLRHLA